MTCCPAALTVVGLTDLTRVSAGAGGIGKTTVDGGEATAGPEGGVPDAVAVSVTEPASTSAGVPVCVAVHVVGAPGTSVVPGHDRGPPLGSVTATVDSVTPFATGLVIRNVYEIVSPASIRPLPFRSL